MTGAPTRTLADLRISPIGLGGNVFGWTADETTSFEVLDAYLDGGGNLIDTADGYSYWAPGNSGGESETVIGAWLASRPVRERVVLATKVSTKPDRPGLSADNIRRARRSRCRGCVPTSLISTTPTSTTRPLRWRRPSAPSKRPDSPAGSGTWGCPTTRLSASVSGSPSLTLTGMHGPLSFSPTTTFSTETTSKALAPGGRWRPSSVWGSCPTSPWPPVSSRGSTVGLSRSVVRGQGW